VIRGFSLALLWAAGMALLQPGPAQFERPARLSEQAKGLAHFEQAKPQIVAAYGRLPLSFEANQGQSDGQVKFLSRGRGYTLFLTSTEAVLSVISPQSTQRTRREHSSLFSASSASSAVNIRLALIGANPSPQVVGREELPGKSNYFLGNDPAKWRTNVPTYRKVEYREVYPGVSLVYYGNQRQLEYDFVVAPGADPGQIRLGVEGADRVEVDAEGDLVLQATAGGQVRFHKPLVYQEVDGARREVEGSFALRASSLKSAIRNPKSEIGFEVAVYDPTCPLVIDPVLVYSTYLGGSGDDWSWGIAVDSSGNAYVTGPTASRNFPTANALQASNRGSNDAFVTKLNAAGSALVYSTYLGGSGEDGGSAIAVDSSGNAYVTGLTSSRNFPTANAVQASYGGGMYDAFVTKLNAAGSALVYSTYLGGSDEDGGSGIAVDSSGNAYVTGMTNSSNFPTANALQASNRGSNDAFVTKLNAAGSALVYSTYLGGSGDEVGLIAVDSSGNAYVTGETSSGNFPTANALQASSGGGRSDAFVTKLNAAGSALVYSTYLGGSGEEGGSGIAVDSSGNAYVTGYTGSSNFPTANALQASNRGSNDAFVTKLNATGSALVYSTYLGGSGSDEGWGIAVDSSGSVYVTGLTDSSNFPTANALQASNRGADDAFVTKLNAAGSALVYSTYLGGNAWEEGHGIAVDSSGNAYVTGYTDSSNFPTAGALQPAFGGGICSGLACLDAFVAKIQVGACEATIAPVSQALSAAGGTGSVAVTAPTGCAWTASSNASWITVTAGSSGNGTVNYSVAANTATASRTGTLTIAGQTFTVTQAGVTCTYTISPASQSFTASAGTGSVAVTALAGCAWTARSNASWITVTAGSSGSGNGIVNYSVAANTATASRTGALTIASQAFTVTQSYPGTVGAAAAAAMPGDSARVPIRLGLPSGVNVDSLSFNLVVIAKSTAPGLTGTLSFSQGPTLPAPTVTVGPVVSVKWQNLPSTLSGVVTLGELVVPIPKTATVGQSYTVQVTGVSGSYGGASVPLIADADATLSVGDCALPAEPTLKINLQPGFYIAEVNTVGSTAPGYWGMEVLVQRGVLSGGFNLGGAVQENGTTAAFGAFYLPSSGTVRVRVDAQVIPGGDPTKFSMGVRLLNSTRQQLGSEQAGTNLIQFSSTLSAGFYIIEARSRAGAPRATFQMGLGADNFGGGVDVGGFVASGLTGFGAFYVPETQDVNIKTLGRSYGSTGASCLSLTLRDAVRNVIRTAP
jgi:hypothetical protein